MLKVPLIGLGTWPMKDECAETVFRATDMGYKHIDTAQYYENEKEVGKGIRRAGIPRRDLFIVTKIRKESFPQAIKSVERSLDDLGLNYVDALLMHDFHDVPLEDMMSTLIECKRMGYARMTGVSNFTESEMNLALPYGCVELRQDKFYPFLKPPEGPQLIAYSPLKYCLEDPQIRSLAKRHGKTPAQIALRWITQQGIAAIPKTSNPERLRENLEIFDFSLE